MDNRMLNTEVLIVGAGPTGLAMACQLYRFGIRCRIIDKSQNRAQESRAFAIQAKTMEIFHTLGLAEEFNKLARHNMEVVFFVEGKQQLKINLEKNLDPTSPYPYVYFLPQNETERILINFLEQNNIFVERQTELINFKQKKNRIEAVIKNSVTQRLETIDCCFLVGCDGAHSAVRHSLNFSFEGNAYKQSFILADARIKWPFDSNQFQFFFAKEGLFIHFPLTKNFSRLIIAPHKKYFSLDSNPPTIMEIENLGELITKKQIELSHTIWLTQFRLHHRGVNCYSKDRVFLAGDAAHIHSPVGGQGMNTGIQDATNLAWKLAMRLRNKTPQSLLLSYESERHPIGKILLKTTDRFFYFISSENAILSLFKQWIFPFIIKQLFLKKKNKQRVFDFISQLHIHYQLSEFVYENTTNADKVFLKGPRAGYRAPNAPTDKKPVFDLLRESPFHVFLFLNRKLNFDELERLKHWTSKSFNWIQVHCMNHNNFNQTLRQRYGVTHSAIYIIRPDGYIGFRCYEINLVAASIYLQQLFPQLK